MFLFSLILLSILFSIGLTQDILRELSSLFIFIFFPYDTDLSRISGKYTVQDSGYFLYLLFIELSWIIFFVMSAQPYHRLTRILGSVLGVITVIGWFGSILVIFLIKWATLLGIHFRM